MFLYLPNNYQENITLVKKDSFQYFVLVFYITSSSHHQKTHNFPCSCLTRFLLPPSSCPPLRLSLPKDSQFNVLSPISLPALPNRCLLSLTHVQLALPNGLQFTLFSSPTSIPALPTRCLLSLIHVQLSAPNGLQFTLFSSPTSHPALSTRCPSPSPCRTVPPDQSPCCLSS